MEETIKDFMTCVVCQDLYNDTTRSPRILNCGHSVCSSCLDRLKASQNKHCPECRSAIPVYSTFPVSYTILRLLQSSCFKNEMDELVIIPKEKNRDIILRFIEDLMERIEEKKTEIIKWKLDTDEKISKTNDLSKDVENIDVVLKGLDIPSELDNEVMEEYENKLKESVALLRDVESKLVFVDNSFTTARPAALSFPIIKDITLDELRRNQSRNYFACIESSDGRKYGKISFGEKLVYIQSLGRDPPPRGSYLIDFHTMRKLSKPLNKVNSNPHELHPHAFMDIISDRNRGRIFYSITDSLLAHQFSLICSGERGATYKGVKVIHKNGFLLMDSYYSSNGYKDSTDIIDGILDNCHEPKVAEKGMIIGSRAMNIGGTFSVMTKNMYSMESSNVIGQVCAGLSLVQNFSYKGGFVAECGLVIDDSSNN